MELERRRQTNGRRRQRRWRRVRARAAALLLVLTLVVTLAVAQGGSAMADEPHAAAATADPTVGPLFVHGLSQGHSCTASVLAGSKDLLLTAAHCITGTGSGVEFVPGYDGTAADPDPYGEWTVNRVWISPAWAGGQDPRADYAVLRVDRQVRHGVGVDIQSVTGGNTVSLFATAGTPVTVTAYAAGADDAPITCTTATFDNGGYAAFRCAGYVSGTSGAPWLVAEPKTAVHQVVGVIGGLNQGGCRDDISYSSRLQLDLLTLMVRAWFGLTGDNVQPAGPDGC